MRQLIIGIAVMAMALSAVTARAVPVIDDTTTCMKIVGYALSEKDVGAVHRAIGKYAAAWLAHYGLPVPKDLQDFGMNVGVECTDMPPSTPVLVAVEKVQRSWR